jgi:hypothetical protein
MECAAFNFLWILFTLFRYDIFFGTDVVPLLACLIDQRKIVHAACSHSITCISLNIPVTILRQSNRKRLTLARYEICTAIMLRIQDVWDVSKERRGTLLH